jgi:hypothetical protein
MHAAGILSCCWAARCRTGSKVRTALLRLLFETSVEGQTRQLAVVWWYEELPASQLRAGEKLVCMSILRWATTTRGGKIRNHYDVIDARIWGPVLLRFRSATTDVTSSTTL